jgi:hypothetical protein
LECCFVKCMYVYLSGCLFFGLNACGSALSTNPAIDRALIQVQPFLYRTHDPNAVKHALCCDVSSCSQGVGSIAEGGQMLANH